MARQVEAGGVDDATSAKVEASAEVDANADDDVAFEATAEVDANAENDAASDDGVEEPSAADAATDTAACDACDVGSDGGVPFASADGSFPCSPYRDATACDRRTQWCAGHNGGFSYSCVSLDTTCSYGPGCTSPDFYWDAAACDGGYQRCVCATVTCSGMGSNGRGFCNDDDAGGVTVTCGTCYGAPPVRLERFVS